MSSANGSLHHVLDEHLDALRKLINRVDPRASESKLRGFATATGEAIKSHPIAAVGIALGVGYTIMRIARR